MLSSMKRQPAKETEIIYRFKTKAGREGGRKEPHSDTVELLNPTQRGTC